MELLVWAGWENGIKNNGGMRDQMKPMLDPRLQLIDGTPVTRNQLSIKLVATSRKMPTSEFVPVFNFSYNKLNTKDAKQKNNRRVSCCLRFLLLLSVYTFNLLDTVYPKCPQIFFA